jgi:hypothetical protein
MPSSLLRGLLCGLILLVPILALAQDMPDLFPGTGPDGPVDPTQITDEFWSTGIFTEVMRLVDNAFTESRWPLFEASLSLLHWLAVLEMSLLFIGLALSNDPQSLLGTMCGQLLVIGFVVEIISQFPTYTEVWTDGCIWAGLTIGGAAAAVMGSVPMTLAEFKDVGLVMLRGLTKLNQPYDYVIAMVSNLSGLAVLKSIPMWGSMLFAWAIAALCFFCVGLLVLVAFVELLIVGGFAIPFLPLLILKQTRPVGMVMLFSMVGAAIRVGTLASLVSTMDGVLGRVRLIDPANIFVGTYFAIAILAFLFAVLAGVLPVKLAGKVSGQSMFGSGAASIVRVARGAH